MQDRPARVGRNGRPRVRSRRDFLRLSALAATAAAAGITPAARALDGLRTHPRTALRGNAMPGRIVLYHDAAMEGHLPAINRDRVAEVVHHGVRLLTGFGETAAAFESLFPGLHGGSRIALKVNCLAWNDTRWEVVRGIVSGLSQMLGGTYDVSQVTIYDVQTDLSDHGYVGSQFTFNGNTALITSTNNCSPDYHVFENHRLSSFVLECDYVINVPALKAHSVGYPEHLITTAFKNHYGSICPQNLCNNIPGMLTVNADPNIKEKTCLVVTSALRGTYQGGPWEPVQTWNTFPDGTPNMLFLTTDPTTEAYWALDTINAERTNRALTAFDCPWIVEASEPPYELGVSDPAQMTVLYADPIAVADAPVAPPQTAILAPNVPNPFASETAIRFRLARASRAALVVTDAAGRVVRRLTDQHFPAGHSEVPWDGRDDGHRAVPAGVYFVRLQTGEGARTRRVVLVR